jgi:hypothetical protein
MNDLEDLLRDAYHGATQTVRAEAIRSLDQPSATISWPARPADRNGHRLWMIPLSAAAAVTAIAATLAAILPNILTDVRDHAKHSQPPVSIDGPPATHFLAAISTATQATITIHSAATGATVARIGSPKQGMIFRSLATGNGVSYVAVMGWPDACGTSLYQFRLNSAGQPTAPTRYAGEFPRQVDSGIALSRDGNALAYWTQSCLAGGAAAHLGVINTRTHRVRQWSIPDQQQIGSLSLSADGSLLEYTTGSTELASGVYVLPTNAPPGPAASRSRLVVRGTQFGPTVQLDSAVLTPDGSTVYFTTVSSGQSSATRWQLRAASVATTTSRLITTGDGLPDALVASPSGSELLVQAVGSQGTSGSSSTSPPLSTSSSSPADLPSTSDSPSQTTSSSPADLPSTSDSPSPTTSTLPVISSQSSKVLWPSLEYSIVRIDLVTGAVTRLNAATWQPQRFTYLW